MFGKQHAPDGFQNEDDLLAPYRPFVIAQVRAGTPTADIIDMLLQQGLRRSQAGYLVDSVQIDFMQGKITGELGQGGMLLVFLGAVLAAGLAGGLWAVLVIITTHPLGFGAWAIGLVAGFAVLVLARGSRGIVLQFFAALATVFGVFVGRYATFVHVLSEQLEKNYGSAAAEQVTPLSLETLEQFLLSLPDWTASEDLFWLAMGIFSAWGIPKVKAAKADALPVPETGGDADDGSPFQFHDSDRRF
jgi:hypothetical protein